MGIPVGREECECVCVCVACSGCLMRPVTRSWGSVLYAAQPYRIVFLRTTVTCCLHQSEEKHNLTVSLFSTPLSLSLSLSLSTPLSLSLSLSTPPPLSLYTLSLCISHSVSVICISRSCGYLWGAGSSCLSLCPCISYSFSLANAHQVSRIMIIYS